MLKIPPPVIVLILVVSNFLSSKKIDIINIPNQTLVSIIIASFKSIQGGIRKSSS